MEKAKVYFTKNITTEAVVKMYETLGVNLPGKVAVKLHSGERGNQNYIRPEFVKAIVEKVNGTVVECNTAYDGARNTTEKHKELMKEHRWNEYFDIDIMDADSAESVVKFFKGNIVYINVMCNMSVDCDCCAVAEDPCMKDIGILASTDPIAIDQACIDLVYNSKDPGRDHFIERVERQHGVHTIEAAADLGYGTREYELIDID